MSDLYYTIAQEAEARYTEKMSRFLAFARKVTNADQARAIVKEYQNSYHDARHVCWAYMLGAERKEWQLNDNGEPSGTAGKPILGQINSRELTDVLVVVVRYFGGIKLGTPGLIAAYREAASEALDEAGRKEMHRRVKIEIKFPYMAADGVMKIVKGNEVEVLNREFDNVCSMTLLFRADHSELILGRLRNVEGVNLGDIEEE
ncbi:MAG: YigZ family protein [Muribaculaceae bacterium]|nr:YigZ family protein [Muribaculaceae bacterium]MDE6755385.1 YigZ family protein [Muribaculaceae bacterium]